MIAGGQLTTDAQELDWTDIQARLAKYPESNNPPAEPGAFIM